MHGCVFFLCACSQIGLASLGIDAQVWWKKLQSECQAVRHSGDKMTGLDQDDDEIISVDLVELPLDVHFLLFVVCVFSPEKTFSQVT